jgi:hypothetical protein
LLEGSHARASAGLAPPQVGQLLHDSAVNLWATALRSVAGRAPTG